MSCLFDSPSAFYTEKNIRYVFIDGNCCHHIRDGYTTLQQQLSLPDYFGHNLDALEEVLNDLEWIPESKIKIIILNKDMLLKDDPENKTAFLDILNSCENEKVEIIYLK